MHTSSSTNLASFSYFPSPGLLLQEKSSPKLTVPLPFRFPGVVRRRLWHGTSHLGLWSFRFPGVVRRRLWHITPGALVFQVMVNTWDSLCRFQGTFVGRTTWICLLPLRSKLSQLWLNSSFARFNSSSATFIMKSKCLYIAFKDLKNLPFCGLLAFSLSLCHSLIHSQNIPLCNCLQLNACHPTSWDALSSVFNWKSSPISRSS